MNYIDFISYRYLTSKKGGFLAFLNFTSVVGIAIGVASLIVVISVMTGFGNNLREKIIGTMPHIIIEKESGIKDFDEIQAKISVLKGVESISPYIQGNVFLEGAGNALGIIARGIDPKNEDSVTRVSKHLIKGRIEDLRGDDVFIGKELARYFGYAIGDTITLISPGSGIAGQNWRYQLRIAGVFETGMADYDMNLVVLPLHKAQEIFNLKNNSVTGLGVRLYNPDGSEEVKQEIYQVLGFSFIVQSWIDLNRNLFEALFLEKWGLFIILTLMVLVASFNIVSTLIVTVTSKIHDIGILQSIGVPQKSIRKIFTKQGILIGVKGIVWGLCIGIALCYVLKTYIKVPKEIYSIDHVPVDIQMFDVGAIVLSAFIISLVSTIYPSMKAASLEPVDALRYE